MDTVADYDAADNSAKCYALAIKCIRLAHIERGEIAPRLDVSDEIEAARRGGWVVDPIAHRVIT